METWKIQYALLVQGETIVREENIEWEEEYYERLKEYWRKHDYTPEVCDPIYKVRRGNYVEFLGMGGFGGGITLPLLPEKGLESAILIASPVHPLAVTVPDGKKFISDNYL